MMHIEMFYHICIMCFIMYRQITPCFVALCLTELHSTVIYKLKVGGNPALSKSIGTIFPTEFAHFVSLCHVLVILTVR